MAQLEYIDTSGNLNVLLFDSCMSETVNGDADITEHPVEQGANITDHKRPKPRTIDLTVIVANQPIQASPTPTLYYDALSKTFNAQGATTPSRNGDAARDVLETLRMSGEPVTVVLGDDGPCTRRYERFELIKVSAPRDVKQGDCFKASLSFKEIIIAISQTVAVPQTKLARAQQTTNRGNQAVAPASPANRSLAVKAGIGLGLLSTSP